MIPSDDNIDIVACSLMDLHGKLKKFRIYRSLSYLRFLVQLLLRFAYTASVNGNARAGDGICID
jgi:hypothetical protein